MAEEWQLFKETTGKSCHESIRAMETMPLGVPSSFQHWDPWPVSIASAQGAYMFDVDGRKLLDLSMGFGAMLAGHLNPEVVKEIKSCLDVGTLFVTPSPISTDAAERICQRFNIDQVRFTNSGTESNMYAVRLARAATGKHGIVKLEGGYHGSYDPFVVSTKPPMDKIGEPENPIPHIPDSVVPGDVYVVQFNDANALEQTFKQHGYNIACFILEPIMENIGICLPDDDYLETVRELCDKYNIVLIFDEVKTGLTAGYQGAAQRMGITPDIITLAKSIGGGVPLAAFGGKKKFMDYVGNGKMPHYGTFNGNPLAMAGVRAMDHIATKENLEHAEALNYQALRRISEIITKYQLPAHCVGYGVKGCITWSPDFVHNYREYKATNFEIAELAWLYAMNRGIVTPPGLDEQWLISLMHEQKEIDLLVDNFLQFAKAIRRGDPDFIDLEAEEVRQEELTSA